MCNTQTCALFHRSFTGFQCSLRKRKNKSNTQRMNVMHWASLDKKTLGALVTFLAVAITTHSLKEHIRLCVGKHKSLILGSKPQLTLQCNFSLQHLLVFKPESMPLSKLCTENDKISFIPAASKILTEFRRRHTC